MYPNLRETNNSTVDFTILLCLWYSYVVITSIFGYHPDGIFIIGIVSLLFSLTALVVFYQRQSLSFNIPYAFVAFSTLFFIGLLTFPLVKGEFYYFEKMIRVLNIAVMILFGINFIRIKDFYKENVFHKSVTLIIIVMIAQVTIAFYDYFSTLERASGFYNNSNHFGVSLALSLLLILPRIIYESKKRKRLFYLMILFLLMSGVLISGSRQAFLGSILGTVSFIFILLTNTKQLSKIIKYIVNITFIFVLFFLVAVSTPLDNQMFNRVDDMYDSIMDDSNIDNSLSGRTVYLEAGIELWRDHPILGVGPDQYRLYAENYGAARKTYAHNNYIEILSTYGLVGFIVYYSIFIFFGFQLIAYRKIFFRLNKKMLWILCVSILIFMLFIDIARITYWGPVEWLIIILILGEFYSVKSRIKSLKRFNHSIKINY